MWDCFRGPTAISGGPSELDVRVLTSTNTERASGKNIDFAIGSAEIPPDYLVSVRNEIFGGCVFAPTTYLLIVFHYFLILQAP
jgi:hypothetical protein